MSSVRFVIKSSLLEDLTEHRINRAHIFTQLKFRLRYSLANTYSILCSLKKARIVNLKNLV